MSFIVYKMQIRDILKTIQENINLTIEMRKQIQFAPKNIDQTIQFSGIIFLKFS